MTEAVTATPEETHECAQNLLHSLTPKDKATVIGFVGKLGAGKTEFIRGMLRAAGVTDPVTSPTYTIETVYGLPESPFSHAYHIDAYRLESADDLADIGFSDRLENKKNLVLVEWADSIKDILPDRTIFVEITIQDEKRVITIINEQGK